MSNGNLVGPKNSPTPRRTKGVWGLNEQANANRNSIWTPDYVTNGLQLMLDAGNKNSYPGSGSTWFDLSGRDNDITLTSVTYSADAGGGLTFGSGSSGSKGSASYDFSSGYTVSVWLKHAGTVSTARTQRYITLASSPAEGPVVRHDTSSNNALHCYIFDASSNFKSVAVASQAFSGVYVNFVFIYDGTGLYLYTNNVQVGSLAGAFTLPTPSSTITLGNGGAEYYEGNLYVVQYYNRNLSSTERAQNYNAFRDRFNLL